MDGGWLDDDQQLQFVAAAAAATTRVEAWLGWLVTNDADGCRNRFETGPVTQNDAFDARTLFSLALATAVKGAILAIVTRSFCHSISRKLGL